MSQSKKRRDIFGAIENAESRSNDGAYGGLASPEFLEKIVESTSSADEEFIQNLKNEIAQLEQTLSGSIVPSESGVLTFMGFRLTRTQLVPPENMTDELFNTLGYVLRGMDDAVQFWIGDWANLYVGDEKVDQVRGELYRELAERFGMQVRTIQNYASVCRNLAVSLRREALSFTHHREVAELPEQLKGREDYFLTWAEENEASVSQLKAHIAEVLSETVGQNKALIEDNSFLFAAQRIPKFNKGFQTTWLKARSGDKKAKRKVLGELTEYRKWMDEIEQSLED